MNEYEKILQAVRDAMNGREPQIDISELLYRHGCYELLNRIPGDHAFADRTRAILSASQMATRHRYRACLGLFARLTPYRYAVVKGAVLSKTAYGTESARVSSDIDLLIARADMGEVRQILDDEGFIQGRVCDVRVESYTRAEQIYYTSMTHQTAPFIREYDSVFCPYIQIDLNSDLFWGESPKKADLCALPEETRPEEIFGVPIRKLAPVSELIALCMHHYKDMNSIYLIAGGSLKLSLFLDIHYYMIRVGPELDTKRLGEICRCLDVTEYLYYCLYQTYELFRDERLTPCLETLRTPKGTLLLDRYGLCDAERKTWNIGLPARLFDDSFARKYEETLSTEDREKIRINRKMM
jgi:hypothetical protein